MVVVGGALMVAINGITVGSAVFMDKQIGSLAPNVIFVSPGSKSKTFQEAPGLAVAKETNTILEIDASPDRLDLRDEDIKLAIENGCKLTIDSDAHDKSHMHFMKFGISQARRGWAEEKHVINTLSLEMFRKSLK